MTESFDESEFNKRFPFPENINKEWAVFSTELFARTRFHYSRREEGGNEEHIVQYNPTLELFLDEYPLPADAFSMILWYTKRQHGKEPLPKTIFPLVERFDTYIGFVKRFDSDHTIGYFLGLVEPYDYFHMPNNERENLSDVEMEYLLENTLYKFTDSMILLEGKLDKSVKRQLEDSEKDYNENILGKFTAGRPRYDPEDYLGPARPIIRRSPDITQRALVNNYLRIDERTFRRWRENAGFKTFREFKNSVLKK